MKRSSIVRVLLLSATLSALTGPSMAQRGKKPKPVVEAKPTTTQTHDLDEGGSKTPTKAASADTMQAQAGQMTEAAAQAKRLFDAGDQWGKAALALDRVRKGETSDDEGNKQIAQYQLAIALFRLEQYQASYAILSEIADKPNHLKFNETLLWLAKLASVLPEPADIVERVGKYNNEQIAKFNTDKQRELFWQLNYLLGRYKYRNQQFDDALGLFSKVDKQSKFYVHSQFFSGVSHINLKRSVPAVQSFQKVVTAIEDGVEGVEDEARMRDLAFLSMARTYYSASIRLDENNSPTIDEQKLSAAVKYWNKVDVASEYWLDSLFEESWAFFMAGDYPHALGNIHTINSPYFPNSHYPEAEIIRAIIYFSNCQYDDAETIATKFNNKYQPIYDELTKILGRFKGDDQDETFYKFLVSVREGKADLKPNVKPLVENSLSDRQLLRNIEYVKELDDEASRFKKLEGAFQSSTLGADVRDALDNARQIAVRNAGQLAKSRYQRYLEDLNEHLRNSAKILIDVTAGRRNQLDTAIAGGQVSQVESKANVVKADEEHVLWPFDGEYWRDELGFYRQTITSKCGR